jgi:hypothetical protein
MAAASLPLMLANQLTAIQHFASFSEDDEDDLS